MKLNAPTSHPAFGQPIPQGAPAPASGSASLETQLRAWVSVCRERTPQHKSAPLWDAAVELILALALDQKDQIPDATPATWQVAAGLLLDLGEDLLLRRLVELNRSIEWVLEVGSSAERADVLARIGASWPSDVSVTLSLDAGLPSEAMSKLRSFVQGPARFSLQVSAEGKIDGPTASAMEQMVGKRTLQALSLNLDEGSTPLLQALCGVQASSICIVLKPSPATAASGSVPNATEDPIAACHGAAVELLRQSGAQVLRLPQSHLDGTLSLRLLATRSHWETVEFNMTDSAAIIDWLSTGENAVRRLELNGWEVSMGLSMKDLLALAAKNGAHTIVFHDAVSLRQLSEALGHHLLVSTHVFDWIEACFVDDDSDSYSDSDDEQDYEHQVVAPLLNNPVVVTVRHKPLEDLPHAPGFSTQGVPISDELQAKLHTMSALNRLVPLSERLPKVQRTVEARRLAAIQTVSSALFLGKDYELSNALLGVPSAFVPFLRSDLGQNFRRGFEGCLELMAWQKVPAWLIQGAVAEFVHNHPDRGPEIARAIMLSSQPKRKLDSKTWLSEGKRYARTWFSEEEAARPESMWAEYSSLLAPPEHPDPNAPGAKPLAIETGVPGSGGGVAAKPVVTEAEQPVHKDPSSLFTPHGTTTLASLKARFEKLLREQPPSEVLLAAVRVVWHLLDSGSFYPRSVQQWEVGEKVAYLLLKAGQGRMLKHIIDHAALPCIWNLTVADSTSANALLGLMPWRQDAQCVCTLKLNAQLSSVDGLHVVQFAKTVQAKQLALSIEMVQPADVETQREIIRSHPGLGLTLSPGPKAIDAGAMETIVTSVSATPLATLNLAKLQSDDKRLVNGVVRLIANTRVNFLCVYDCGLSLTHAAMTSRRWERLNAWSSDAVEKAFASGQVSAKQLRINMQKLPDVDEQVCAETMVTRCKDLRSVEIYGLGVHAPSLAGWLDQNRSVGSVTACVDAFNQKEWAAALADFQRNRSLVRLNLTGDEIPPWFLRAIQQLETHNRMRHPDLAAIGAGKGFGFGIDGLDMRDVGGHIGSMLDLGDLDALSLITKAAYFASRKPWEDEIDRLTKLLGIEDSGTFKAKLVLQLTHLHQDFPVLSGTAPTDETPAGTLLEKVAVMQAASVPNFAIGEALRRALKPNLASSALCQSYLEAMVTVGEYPAKRWLKDVAGIDVEARGAAYARVAGGAV